MGEAKRRGPRAPSEANRLPEFIFAREKLVEDANDFLLAGKILTNIPHGKEPSENEKALITEFIQELTRLVARKPDLEEAGAWRNGVKPPDGFAPPYPDGEAHGGVRMLARQGKLQSSGRTAAFKANRAAMPEGQSSPPPLELIQLRVYQEANNWTRIRLARAWGTSGWAPLLRQIQK